MWSSFTCGFRHALRSYGPATAQLPLLNGNRYADFLLGTTLLEVESGRLDEGRYLDELLRQVLIYMLLAHHDGHAPTHTAIYPVRYQRLLRHPIPELADRLAGEAVNLSTVACLNEAGLKVVEVAGKTVLYVYLADVARSASSAVARDSL